MVKSWTIISGLGKCRLWGDGIGEEVPSPLDSDLGSPG
jgi:hypothetical protein